MKMTNKKVLAMSAVLAAAFLASRASPACAEDIDKMAERLDRMFDRAEDPVRRWDQVFNRMDLGVEYAAPVVVAAEAEAVAAAEHKEAKAPAGEKEIDAFIAQALKRIKASEEPRQTGNALRKETEDLMKRADSPGAVMSLMIFRDKNIADAVEAREAELYKENTPRDVRAEQAAAKMRALVAEEQREEKGRGELARIRHVSVERDFLGRPRLNLLVDQLDSMRRCRSCTSQKEKFERAVEWNFSCDSFWHCDEEERPMAGFGIGYRIEYAED